MPPALHSRLPPALAQAAIAVAARLQSAGHQAVWAGGAVRDLLLGRVPKDVDVATDAPPDRVQQLFAGSRAYGKSFGVVQVEQDGLHFEVATFRRDLDYSDGRRPDGVVFAAAEEDARRRDFTINGLFYDPAADRVIDYVDGQADLAARRLRAIGDPVARFTEDHLRLLRAVRFAAVLEFELEPATARAIPPLAARLERISAERIQQELQRMLLEPPRPSRAFRLLSELGLLAVVLPEVEALRGVEQPPQFHPEGDVFEHTMLMLDAMQDRSPALAWSVLLHDIGKPPTFRVSTEPDGSSRIRFDRHDRVGAEMAETLLTRLRHSRQLTADVVHCVRQHMRFMHVQEMRPGKLRQLIAAPTFPVELELHRVDCLSSHRDLSNYTFLLDQRARLAAESALPRPLLDGHALLAAGVPPGPTIGRWRTAAYEAQLDGEFDDVAGALAWLRTHLAQVDGPRRPD